MSLRPIICCACCALLAACDESPGRRADSSPTDLADPDRAVVADLAPDLALDAPAAEGGPPADSALDRASGDDALQYDVALELGDDFQQANDSNPAGTTFLVRSGTHVQQRVDDPQTGNRWVGEAGAVMDGQDQLTDAFHGSATDVHIAGITITGYVDNGIFFSSGSAVVVHDVTVTDTGSGSGESNGAIRLDNLTDITVRNCHIERTSSGVLPTGCTGPIVIEHNTGVNIGRNMVQLAACSGGGIRVSYNSMERVGTYLRPGAEDVEDWISVWKVQGLAGDPAQIHHNRARGHGPSSSGSFIMLGDGGGRYQEAVGNIGVTPGQVGIGLSGGEQIEVRGNVMFSESWPNSNIAFYSSNYGGSAPCTNHVISDNRANWINRDGVQNTFWSSGNCAPLTKSGNTFPDPTVDQTIWNSWPCVP